MASESIILTVDEVSSLQAAVESIVSAGIKLQDADHQIPVVKTGDVGAEGDSVGKPELQPD